MPFDVFNIESKTITPESVNKFLRSWGFAYQKLVKEAFDNQGWSSNSWAPRMVPNVVGILNFLNIESRVGVLPNRFFDNRPALQDTGELRNSITVSPVENDSITVGTSKEYARKQQYGLPSVIPITAKMKANILLLLKEGKYKFLKPYLKKSSITIKPIPRTIFGWNDKADEVLIDTIRKNFKS